MQVTYIGDEDEIEVWYGSNIGCVDIVKVGEEDQLKAGIHDELIHDVFKNGETKTVVWTGKEEKDLFGPFGVGNYNLNAYVDFSLDKEQEDALFFSFSLPMVIEK